MAGAGVKERSARLDSGVSQSTHKSAVAATSARPPERRSLGAQPTYTSVRWPMLVINAARLRARMPMKKRASRRPLPR